MGCDYLPVPMSKYGLDNGDCLTACIASILRCGIDDIPDLSGMGNNWLRATVELLESRGHGSIFVPAEKLSGLVVSDCLCVAMFKTDSPELHAKLGRWKSEIDGDVWRYEVAEEYDPNERGVDCGDLHSVLVVFPRLAKDAEPASGLHKECGAYHYVGQCPCGGPSPNAGGKTG